MNKNIYLREKDQERLERLSAYLESNHSAVIQRALLELERQLKMKEAK